MSEAPKKIWMAEHAAFEAYTYQLDGDISYIRADLVDGLVFALNECLRVNGYQNAREMIHAALAALEEE